MERSKESARGNASFRGHRGSGNQHWKSNRGGRGGAANHRNDAPNQQLFKEQKDRNKLQLQQPPEGSGGCHKTDSDLSLNRSGPDHIAIDQQFGQPRNGSGGGHRQGQRKTWETQDKLSSSQPAGGPPVNAWMKSPPGVREAPAGGDANHVDLVPKSQEEEDEMYALAVKQSMEDADCSVELLAPDSQESDRGNGLEMLADVPKHTAESTPASGEGSETCAASPPPLADRSGDAADPQKREDEYKSVCSTGDIPKAADGDGQVLAKAQPKSDRNAAAKKANLSKDMQPSSDSHRRESPTGGDLGLRSREKSASPVTGAKTQDQGKTIADKRSASNAEVARGEQRVHRNGHQRYVAPKHAGGQRGQPRSTGGEQRHSDVAPAAKPVRVSPTSEISIVAASSGTTAECKKPSQAAKDSHAGSPESSAHEERTAASNESRHTVEQPPRPSPEPPTLCVGVPTSIAEGLLMMTQAEQPLEERIRVLEDKLARWEALFGTAIPEVAHARQAPPRQQQQHNVVPYGVAYGVPQYPQFGTMPPQYPMTNAMPMPLLHSYSVAIRPSAPQRDTSNDDSTDSNGDNGMTEVFAAMAAAPQPNNGRLVSSRPNSAHDAMSQPPMMQVQQSILGSFPPASSSSHIGFITSAPPPGYVTGNGSGGGQSWNGGGVVGNLQQPPPPPPTTAGQNDSRLSATAVPFFPLIEESSPSPVETHGFQGPYGYSPLPNPMMLMQQQQMVSNAIASYQNMESQSTGGGYPGQRSVRGAIDNGCYRRYDEPAVPSGYQQQQYGMQQYNSKRPAGGGHPEYQVPPYPETLMALQQQQQQAGVYVPQQAMLYNPGGGRYVSASGHRNTMPKQRGGGRGRGMPSLGPRY